MNRIKQYIDYLNRDCADGSIGVLPFIKIGIYPLMAVALITLTKC